MRSKLIFNPWANRGKAIDLKDSIIRSIGRYSEAEISVTEGQRHATQLAAAAIEDGHELVIAAGGDGTVHEVVNGLVHGDRGQATLGVIPTGSGNDFAFGMGLLTDPENAVRHIFEGSAHSVDLARLEDDRGRYVVVDNGIGIGFDATVNIQSQTITRLYGFPMYLLAVLRTIALYFQTPHLQVRFDDEVVDQEALLLAVGIGRRVGGGFYLTPDASFDDNMLDSCTVNTIGRLTMLWMLPKVMRGTHVTSKHVTMRRNHYIDITSNMPLPVHVDGEVFAYPQDNVRRLTMTSLPSALRVMKSVGT